MLKAAWHPDFNSKLEIDSLSSDKLCGVEEEGVPDKLLDLGRYAWDSSAGRRLSRAGLLCAVGAQ